MLIEDNGKFVKRNHCYPVETRSAAHTADTANAHGGG